MLLTNILVVSYLVLVIFFGPFALILPLLALTVATPKILINVNLNVFVGVLAIAAFVLFLLLTAYLTENQSLNFLQPLADMRLHPTVFSHQVRSGNGDAIPLFVLELIGLFSISLLLGVSFDRLGTLKDGVSFFVSSLHARTGRDRIMPTIVFLTLSLVFPSVYFVQPSTSRWMTRLGLVLPLVPVCWLFCSAVTLKVLRGK